MYQVVLSEGIVTVISKNGTETTIDDNHRYYEEARNAALNGEWNEYYGLVKDTGIDHANDNDVFAMMGIATSLPDMISQIAAMTGMGIVGEESEPTVDDIVNQMKGWIEDGVVDPVDLGLTEIPKIDEHDLSNWNGSPIFYDNEDEAREQARKSMGFWKFHDFGLNQDLQSKYRYATVPTGFGPTAPVGYDWVCLKRK